MEHSGEESRPCGPCSPEVEQGPGAGVETADTEAAWYALYVNVKHEKEVVKRLDQKSVECFLPIVERWSKRKDRRKKIDLPLFPGYVFVRTVLSNQVYACILQAQGALRILRNSEGPLSIPNYQIENLITMLRSAPSSESILLHSYIKEGDWIRVVNGPFTGCVGILLRQNQRKGRLVVSVDTIQRSISVELNCEDVERLELPPSGDRRIIV